MRVRSWRNWNLDCWFLERGKSENPEKNPRCKTRTNHIWQRAGIEPMPHRWQASTHPSPHRFQLCYETFQLFFVDYVQTYHSTLWISAGCKHVNTFCVKPVRKQLEAGGLEFVFFFQSFKGTIIK